MRDEERDRPSPEELLKAIWREESEQGKGRLKIFLGMAAGVGKTFAMLEEGQELHKANVDVVVGIVDTHGREETAALLKGLKIVPPKIIIYRDKEFQELDIDAIIELRPKIALVDELAHSNVPGSRHNKRWEDVIEILENGIDVYTTLNVQHIESLNDVIESITGISVKETVPDSIIEKAASIQLVDLTPDELLERLKEGKVYLGNQSQIAAKNFFQKNRLTALREIVLRFTAEKVDHDLHGMIPEVERLEIWRAREKILVAVSPSPHSQKLIRTSRRLAFRLDAPWIAVYINDGRILSENENNQLEKNLSLARELGAEVITANDPDIADSLNRIARQRGVTQIIIGRAPRKSFFDFFKRTGLLERLARECIDIDIHVIRQDKLSGPYKKQFSLAFRPIKIFPFILSFLWVLCLTGISWLALPYIGYNSVGVIFLLGILSLSLVFKKGPIFFASILYALIWKFVFIPPMEKSDEIFTEETAILALYFLTAIVTGVLVDRAREYKEILAKREETVQALYDILKLIVTSPSIEAMLKSVQESLGKIISGTFEIIIKKLDNGLALENSRLLKGNDKEKSVATWAFENDKEAGWSTSTLPMSKNLYLPIKGFHEVVGVLIYNPKLYRFLSTEQKNFIYTVGRQLANYIEKIFSEERERQSENIKQVEKIYHTVLKSISHEFQNPLTAMQDAIYEAFQALKYDQLGTSHKAIPQISKIERTSTGIQRMMDNVSVMAKLSSDTLHVNKQLNSVRNLIKLACDKIKPQAGNRKIFVKIQDEIPDIRFDRELLEVVLINILRNAIDNSPNDSKIEIEARLMEGKLAISVLDEGAGIPANMLESVFDEFYRLPGTQRPGLGLGLTISKRIAEIHDGYLIGENRPTGGAKFSLYIPIT